MITPESVKVRPLHYLLIHGVKVLGLTQKHRADGTTVAVLQEAMTNSLDGESIYISYWRNCGHDNRLIDDMIAGGHIYNPKRFTWINGEDLMNNLNSLEFGQRLRAYRRDVKIYIDHFVLERYLWLHEKQFRHARNYSSGRGAGKSFRNAAEAFARFGEFADQFVIQEELNRFREQYFNGIWSVDQASHDDAMESAYFYPVTRDITGEVGFVMTGNGDVISYGRNEHGSIGDGEIKPYTGDFITTTVYEESATIKEDVWASLQGVDIAAPKDTLRDAIDDLIEANRILNQK